MQGHGPEYAPPTGVGSRLDGSGTAPGGAAAVLLTSGPPLVPVVGAKAPVSALPAANVVGLPDATRHSVGARSIPPQHLDLSVDQSPPGAVVNALKQAHLDTHRDHLLAQAHQDRQAAAARRAALARRNTQVGSSHPAPTGRRPVHLALAGRRPRLVLTVTGTLLILAVALGLPVHGKPPQSVGTSHQVPGPNLVQQRR